MPEPNAPHRPPRLAKWLLYAFLSDEERPDVFGDLEEHFVWRVGEYGRRRAAWCYYLDVVTALPAFVLRSLTWTIIMLKYYLKTAFGNFRRQKAYSIINVSGLAVGLACAFFIVLWVNDERSYDEFHEGADQIYRVMRNENFSDGRITTTGSVPKPLDEVLDEEYPEITHSVLTSWEQSMVIARGDNIGRALGQHFGPDLFTIFSFPLIIGDPDRALNDPESIVLSEKLARRYFGDDWRFRDDILGTILRIDNRIDLAVTGVYEDIPANSSIRFDFAIPVEDFNRQNTWVEHWGNSGLGMYVRLEEGADHLVVSEKIENMIKEHHESSNSTIFLQPLKDLYLRSEYENGVAVGGRIEYLQVLSLIAIFVILIASINFMNLATARSAQRAREVGVRKSVGASRSHIARQFLGESVITVVISSVFALGLVTLLLSNFNGLTDKSIALGEVDAKTWMMFAGLALATGILSGSYPAIYLSAFNVIGVLRGAVHDSRRSVGLRKSLVVLQFVFSIALIVGTVTVYKQIDYIRSKNLGLDRENLIYVDLEGGIKEQYDTFRQELLKQPGIARIARSSQNPLDVGQSTGDPEWVGKDPEENTTFQIIRTGYDFITTVGIELLEGRLYSREFTAEENNFIINQRAAKVMGMDEPVGERLSFWDRDGQIIGVVADFHSVSLYDPIEPLIFVFAPFSTNRVFIRTQAGQTIEAIGAIERIYERFNPEFPFKYLFVDDEFEVIYRSEVIVGTLASYFAILAIFIACLGLLGLASFTAERRTKEIGIRKVLGASVTSVVLLLSRDFVKLVLIAFVVAAPIAYFVMRDWLDGFAYHTNIGVGMLTIAGTAAVAIAAITVSYQSVRAAVANPASSLRSE